METISAEYARLGPAPLPANEAEEQRVFIEELKTDLMEHIRMGEQLQARLQETDEKTAGAWGCIARCDPACRHSVELYMSIYGNNH